MNLSQVSEIRKLGHEIGVHGYDHVRLGNLSKDTQRSEILKALHFLKKNNLLNKSFTMNYPYGHYNSDTLDILSEINCSIGITTIPNNVPNKYYSPLELPRLDTNDFPKNQNEIASGNF